MSGPVDVLALLSDRSRYIGGEGYDATAGDLMRVHAAVAELIEAAINVHAAGRAGKEPDLIALADCIDAVGAKAARKAALANVGGAK